MRTWKNVATLVKTKGLQGRFVVRSAAGLPFLLEEGMQVAFVPPRTDLPRTGVVDFVRPIDDDTYEVGFDSVTADTDVHGLVGCRCLVKRSAIDESALVEAPGFWMGWNVELVSGEEVGSVVDLIENPGQSLLEIERDHANNAFIPVVDEFIVSIDEEAKRIVVDVPAGLLDL